MNREDKNMNKFAAFLGGVVFGTAGLKVLASRGAKKVYVHTTATLRPRWTVRPVADFISTQFPTET